jgi:uncharacterized protein
MIAPFHVLAKPTGAVCNLDCSYCFYLVKEELYPDSDFRMKEQVLDAYLRQLVEAHAGMPQITVAWQGGEPTLMGLPFFRRVVERLATLVPAGVELEHTLQTNGVRLDDEWCAFLAQHRVLVGLSIDGPREMHDAYRVDKGGRGTFDQVVRAARLLRAHKVEHNALVTVHAANQDHPLTVYRFLRDELGIEFIQLIPIVERLDEGGLEAGGHAAFSREQAPITDRTVSSEAWGEFLVAVFDEWVRHDIGRVFVPTFESAVASWLGLSPAMCIFRETCGNAVALEHNGDLYSCDHFVTPAHRLGNVLDTTMRAMVDSPRQRAFGCAKKDGLPPQCQSCTVRFACNGACPKDRFLADQGGQPGLNYLCAGYFRFFTHIDGPMRLIANLLKAGLPAEQAMTALRQLEDPEAAGLGRNSPCPCGSGRKLKACHGSR